MVSFKAVRLSIISPAAPIRPFSNGDQGVGVNAGTLWLSSYPCVAAAEGLVKLQGECAVDALEGIAANYGHLRRVRLDNGSEFISKDLDR